MPKLSSSCRCLFDAMTKLHAMANNKFDVFLIRKPTWILHVTRAYSVYDLYLVYVVETFITLN